MPVAVLFARANSIYFDLAEHVYDEKRDALTYSGSFPVVAHPPCRGWGRLRHLAKVLPGELDLAIFAVDTVRRCGGVLEHPAHSSLWGAADLPAPGKGFDSFGGFTFPVYQSAFGHRAPKATWLYIVGISPFDLPDMPFELGFPPGRIEFMGTAERESTPEPFARFLLAVADLAGASFRVTCPVTRNLSIKSDTKVTKGTF